MVLKIEFREDIVFIQVGYSTNYQKRLNLASGGCFYKGIIQHELLHVLGMKFIRTILFERFPFQAFSMNSHDLIAIHTSQSISAISVLIM